MNNTGHDAEHIGILSRIDHILFQPHTAILGSRLRQQARFLSILLVIGIPIFIYAQTTSDITGFPVYLIVLLSYLFAYVISRTRRYHLAAGIAVAGSSTISIGILIYTSSWLPTDIPRFLIWGTFSILVGALFIRPRYVIIQYSIIFFSHLSISIFQFNLPIEETIEFFLADMLVAGLIIISAFMLHDYASKTETQYASSEKRRWELEVYTQLLRHDIRNDLHALLGTVELAEMLMELNPKSAIGQLSTSLRIGESIVGLLDAFSNFPQDVEMNLVSQIEQVATEARDLYEGLDINIASTKRAREVESVSNRLMPMVWMNIFRNSVQHAGPSPHVDVSIFDLEDSLKITTQDNGPGILDEDKAWFFVKGNPAEDEDRGIGMYLARVIIESHGGTIEVVDNVGCKLEINLPL